MAVPKHTVYTSGQLPGRYLQRRSHFSLDALLSLVQIVALAETEVYARKHETAYSG